MSALLAAAAAASACQLGPSPSPFATPLRSATPVVTADAATALVLRYLAAITLRDYPTAWGLLSAEAQAAYRSPELFASDWSATFATARGRYTVKPARHNLEELRFWRPEAAGPIPSLDNAFIVEANWPELASRNNDIDIYMVAVDSSGAVRIWELR